MWLWTIVWLGVGWLFILGLNYLQRFLYPEWWASYQQQMALKESAHAPPSSPHRPRFERVRPATRAQPAAVAPVSSPMPQPVALLPHERDITDAQWSPAPLARTELLELVAKVPHLMLVGPSRAGKTTTARAILSCITGQVVVIDPDYDPGAWGALDVVTAHRAFDFKPIKLAFARLMHELDRRVQLMHEGRKDELTPLTIVWDEVPECIEEVPEAGDFLRRIARRGAKYGFRLVLLTQSDRVKALGIEGHGDVRSNFVHIIHSRIESTSGVQFLATIGREGMTPRGMDTSWTVEASKNVTADRSFPLDTVPVESATTAPAWSDEHLKVVAWLASDPAISTREIARRLYPGTDGSGPYFVKAKALKGDVLPVIEGFLAGIERITAQNNTPAEPTITA